jgi:diaminohydroxyphosphoribosylaminopyrimidine deaminase/5-amino-6-(5-phosphoribosylamino)uracil reductase
VYDGRIIAEGYHQQYGGPHAEVNCITSVADEDKKFIVQSTLYVSLEPCAHFGKTPPCADLIIHNKIPKVVIGCRDPFKEVNGKGIEKLRSAGVDVKHGVLENACKELNKRFFTFHTKQQPFVILKWAQTADGKISSGTTDRLFISNEISNRLVHKWRTEEQAILVGKNTALSDDPSLNVRLAKGNNPIRLVLDRDISLPTHLKIFDRTQRTIIFNTIKHEEGEQLSYYKITNDGNIIQQLLKACYEFNIQSILVEGGATLLQLFIDNESWDEARVITNTSLFIGSGLAAPQIQGTPIKQQQFLTDTISYFRRDVNG